MSRKESWFFWGHNIPHTYSSWEMDLGALGRQTRLFHLALSHSYTTEWASEPNPRGGGGSDFNDFYPDVCVEGMEKDPF